MPVIAVRATSLCLPHPPTPSIPSTDYSPAPHAVHLYVLHYRSEGVQTELPRVGFLADMRRMNVGLTRGVRAMWVVCHAATLAYMPVPLCACCTVTRSPTVSHLASVLKPMHRLVWWLGQRFIRKVMYAPLAEEVFGPLGLPTDITFMEHDRIYKPPVSGRECCICCLSSLFSVLGGHRTVS
jgi:hypothetical protein